MSLRPRARRLLARAVLLASGAFALGCASEQTLARDLVNAARPSRLPLVVACWEKEFEDADFTGEYVATVTFTVEGDTSKLRDAKVVSLDPSRDTPAHDVSAFQSCIEDALNRSALPTAPDDNGPGFKTSSDLAVKNYRIQFTDASAAKRKLAAARQKHVLLGPRADRCQGLYAYDPPRDPTTLYNDIAASEAKAFHAKDTERDVYARELQKAYDAKLELLGRMAADLADPLLPDANKKRTAKERKALEASARKTGAEIGCSLPSRGR